MEDWPHHNAEVSVSLCPECSHLLLSPPAASPCPGCHGHMPSVKVPFPRQYRQAHITPTRNQLQAIVHKITTFKQSIVEKEAHSSFLCTEVLSYSEVIITCYMYVLGIGTIGILCVIVRPITVVAK